MIGNNSINTNSIDTNSIDTNSIDTNSIDTNYIDTNSMNRECEEFVWLAEVPSNIAFQKYWGKRDAKTQWPTNDSISMTLSASKTTTKVVISKNQYHSFTFGDETIRSDQVPDAKIFRHIRFLQNEFGSQLFFDVNSFNTFPSDCGIASSASGYGALTLATVSAMTGSTSWSDLALKGISQERLAHLSRMGSGSAGRSLFGGFVHWIAGVTPDAQRLVGVKSGSEPWDLADLIVVLSDEKKSVGSSAAHLAAPTSPFFKDRIDKSTEITNNILDAIRTQNLAQLGSLIEADCLDMHAIAATGTPSIQYLSPRTIDLVEWIRNRRHEQLPSAFFTIDAGPNPHIICEQKDAETLLNELKNKWPETRIIQDRIGSGPTISCKKITDSLSARVNTLPNAFNNTSERVLNSLETTIHA